MLLNEKGFTLVEIMVVAIIIALIVGIGLANFIQLQNRAKEASVKSNMHALQLAMEDFAVHTLGVYPDNGASTTPAGQTVADLCQEGVYPENPFSGAVTAVAWDADPGVSGQIGVNPANTTDYIIKGFGKSVILLTKLTSGG